MIQCLFSVIIPIYNRASSILPTLTSVLAQQEQSFEILLVDDHSEDIALLENVINKIDDPRIILFKHGNNLNGAAARNTGLKNASGQYVAFLDSDDIWPSNKLSIYKEEIERNQHNPIYVYYSQVNKKKYIGDDTVAIVPERGINGYRVSDYLFIHNGLIQTSTIVCTLESARKIMFDDRFKRHQDYDFCIRAEALGYQFFFINKPLSDWIKQDSEKSGYDIDFKLFWIQEMKHYCTKRAFSAYKVSLIAPYAFMQGRKLLTVKLLMSSLFSCPKFIYKYTAIRMCKNYFRFLKNGN